jgi:hydrogenase expression/formation protein HypC
MRITALDGARATIAAEGLEQECSVMLVPGAAVGDFVLVHAGFALSVLDAAEAQQTYDLLREIGSFDDGDAPDDVAAPEGVAPPADGTAPDTGTAPDPGAAGGDDPR